MSIIQSSASPKLTEADLDAAAASWVRYPATPLDTGRVARRQPPAERIIIAVCCLALLAAMGAVFALGLKTSTQPQSGTGGKEE
jgi:hypothetical protein